VVVTGVMVAMLAAAIGRSTGRHPASQIDRQAAAFLACFEYGREHRCRAHAIDASGMNAPYQWISQVPGDLATHMPLDQPPEICIIGGCVRERWIVVSVYVDVRGK
jgi:hypothetical protein